MGDEMRFVVVAVDGDPADIDNICIPSIRYGNLTWAESVELARISFRQGYCIIVWRQEEGGGGECAKA